MRRRPHPKVLEKLCEWEKKLPVSAEAVCCVLGVIIGILLALEFRIHGGLDKRFVATGLGIFFGAVIGLTIVDIMNIITGRKDH